MSWFNYSFALNLCKNDIFFNSKQIQCVPFLDFFGMAQETRELIKNRELNLYVSLDRLSHRTKSIQSGQTANYSSC